MTVEEHLKEIFTQALERSSLAELDDFLAEACKDRPELRSQVDWRSHKHS